MFDRAQKYASGKHCLKFLTIIEIKELFLLGNFLANVTTVLAFSCLSEAHPDDFEILQYSCCKCHRRRLCGYSQFNKTTLRKYLEILRTKLILTNQ